MNAPEGRMEAAREVGRLLGTQEGRQRLGVGRARTVLPADWDESIGEVFARLTPHHPPAVIAVLYGADIKLLEVEPAPPSSNHELISPRSTIGMLYQAVEQAGSRSLTARIDDWSAVTASPMPIDQQLLIEA